MERERESLRKRRGLGGQAIAHSLFMTSSAAADTVAPPPPIRSHSSGKEGRRIEREIK